MDEFADLVLEVGDAYLALGEHRNALRFYKLLEGNIAFDDVNFLFLCSLQFVIPFASVAPSTQVILVLLPFLMQLVVLVLEQKINMI